ncbi:hypothetical protein ACQPYK_25985 [Streptosporangium sp. CA-135522]|uniref:hypothetical protein n=1 Tax=Streptosporangium sp. CA-135522 TaxID=3240072 RepID=UPI003D8F64DE
MIKKILIMNIDALNDHRTSGRPAKRIGSSAADTDQDAPLRTTDELPGHRRRLRPTGSMDGNYLNHTEGEFCMVKDLPSTGPGLTVRIRTVHPARRTRTAWTRPLILGSIRPTGAFLRNDDQRRSRNQVRVNATGAGECGSLRQGSRVL